MTSSTRPSKLDQARTRAAEAEAAAASAVGPVEAARDEVAKLEAAEAEAAAQRRRQRLEQYVADFDVERLAQASMDAALAFKNAVLQEHGADVLPRFLAWQRARTAGYAEAQFFHAVRRELNLPEMSVIAPSAAALDFLHEVQLAVADLVVVQLNDVTATLEAALER